MGGGVTEGGGVLDRLEVGNTAASCIGRSPCTASRLATDLPDASACDPRVRGDDDRSETSDAPSQISNAASQLSAASASAVQYASSLFSSVDRAAGLLLGGNAVEEPAAPPAQPRPNDRADDRVNDQDELDRLERTIERLSQVIEAEAAAGLNPKDKSASAALRSRGASLRLRSHSASLRAASEMVNQGDLASAWEMLGALELDLLGAGHAAQL